MLLIKCSLHDFCNIIRINSMSSWPCIQSGYSCDDCACVLYIMCIIGVPRRVRIVWKPATKAQKPQNIIT
jgi:hypothetical protein